MPGSRNNVRLLLTLLGLLIVLPWPAAAQSGTPAWTLTNGAATTTVQEARSAGYGAVPVTALAILGAEVSAAGGEIRVRFGEREFRFRVGSPFFSTAGAVRQFIYPVYEEAGVVHLPVQFLVDALPAALGSSLQVDVPNRTVRRVGAVSPRAAAEPRPSTGQPSEPQRAIPPAAARAPERTVPAPSASAPPAPAPAAPASRRLVVIDAGHGGVDPGAIGVGGAREKDVTLAIARQVASILRQDPTMEVRMTRDRDTLIALADRRSMANRWRADGQPAVFISIHANASDHRSAHGFETYFLSEAKTEDAMRVAQRENAAQRFESPSQRLDPLSFILQDLRLNKYLRDSSDWAAMVQRRLATVKTSPNRGVKQAGFVVLNGVMMPAVLVEVGFITNPQEERVLAERESQQRIAEQLAHSIRDFFGHSATATTAAGR